MTEAEDRHAEEVATLLQVAREMFGDDDEALTIALIDAAAFAAEVGPMTADAAAERFRDTVQATRDAEILEESGGRLQ